jgi:TPR repeat protein
VKWYRKAADQGYAQAQHTLGIFYAEGDGVAKDQVEALKWYRKAADQGYAAAQYTLGICYAEGDDVVKDQVGPIIWLHKTAGQAQFNLGVVKDEVEAAKWYRKAADQGSLKSQYFIGLRYKAGIGVAKDEVEAYAYLSLAGTAVEAAREELASLEAGISPDARLRGQQRAKQLQEEVEAKIAANKSRAFGFHLPWPGIGTVVPKGEQYAWVPERWSWGS